MLAFNQLLVAFLVVSRVVPFGAVQQVVFKSVREGGVSAPAASQSAALPRLSCAERCARLSDCAGFSWLQDLCRLFNWTAFAATEMWRDSPPCSVYARQRGERVPETRKLDISSCRQSSQFSMASCTRAIDGNQNQNFFGRSCSGTSNGVPGAWWEAQLAQPSVVSFVTIYNRQDCCPERLNAFSLQLDGVECNRVNLTEPFSVANFSCNSFGSRVRVQSLLADPVNICEFEAFGF